MRRLVLAVLLAVLLPAAALGSPAVAATGPDVSRYQHPDGRAIDWQRVAADGQDFAYVKATEGTTVRNAWYAADSSDARAAGLYVGAYHFARPSTADGSAAAQARVFAEAIGDQQRPGTLPPALDLESNGGLSRAQLDAWTRTFLVRLQELTGRTPVLYTYPSFWESSMGSSRAFGDYPLWIAHYTRAVEPTHTGWDDWTFWQYTASGSLPGITGDVDMNRFRGTNADLARLALAAPPAQPSGTPTGTSPGAFEVARDTAPGGYTPVAPQRVLDTRTGTGAPTGRVDGTLTLTLPDAVPADAAGVVLSLSAVTPTGAGYLRAAPLGQTARTTALNYVRRDSSTGLVVTRTDAARRVALTVSGGAPHLVADLVGYYDVRQDAGGHWVPLAPSRLYDSRTGGGAPVEGDVTVTLPGAVPTGARGAVLNVSVVEAVRDAYVQTGAEGARATVLNVAGGTSRTGLVHAAPGRDVRLTVRGGPGHVVVDLLGYYGDASTTGARYVGTSPARVVDTRTGLGGEVGARTVTVELPGVEPGATAVLDVSAVDPTGSGYLRVGPTGEQAVTTALNHGRGASQTGLVLSRTDASRRVTLTLYGAPAGLVVDLVGQLSGSPKP